MKNTIFTIISLSLCLFTIPSWAMDDDDGSESDSHRSVESYKGESVDNTNVARVDGTWTEDDGNQIDFHRSVESYMDHSNVPTVGSSHELSSSTSTDSNDRKTFFVHIPNASASDFYRTIVEDYQFSIHNWRRRIARSGTLEENQKIFSSCQLGEELCHVMRRVLKKFRATQMLMRIGDSRSYGLIIQLNTAKEHPVEMVKKYCQRSRYIYQVLANKDALRHYMGTSSNIPLNMLLPVVKPLE